MPAISSKQSHVLTVSGLFALLGSLWASTLTAQTNTSIGTLIDATQPGPGACTSADNTGATDSFAAVSCKLAAFSSAGGILFFPSGTYLLNSPIVVPPNVSVRGTGYGSVLKQPSTVTSKFVTLKKSSSLRDIKLTQVQPMWGSGTWTPNVYDYQVWASDFDITIENVMLLNPYQGVLVESSGYPAQPIGQVYIHHLEGQPLKMGIFIDGDADISRFEDIHFWPFWSYAPGDQNSLKVAEWTQANGFGIASLRDDNPYFANVFTYSYNYGFYFTASTGSVGQVVGPTSRPNISNYNCDFCNFGVAVVGTNTEGIQMSNAVLNTINAPIIVTADYVSATFTNLDVTGTGSSVVYVQGNYDSIVVGDSTIREWNINGSGYPAFQIVTGKIGSVMTVSNVLYNNGHGGSLTSGSTIYTSQLNSATGLFP